ncbi:hypothetical protein [Actinophytocola algeriensis]|uniref:Uncharacterized protein n=1 Tax=Actinophytocola algeriensis TaxID=1768010 RepID=A0A7W7Q4X2_9PSEU|nr:hypothetical protein [Actinophytocola algeriensis]MBB4907135.1 hypothetical protein [Actinophytocola algeriensis]MBE1478618.1 hypothetical protein [Actinophytocola algeriensis]
MATPVARKPRKAVPATVTAAEAAQAPPAPATAEAGPDTPPPAPAAMMAAATTAQDMLAPAPPSLDEQGIAIGDGLTVGWVHHRMITHLWSYDAVTGVWVWVDGIGWKRLSPVSEHGHSHLCLLATLATDRNLPVDYHEDAAGRIDQLLV